MMTWIARLIELQHLVYQRQRLEHGQQQLRGILTDVSITWTNPDYLIGFMTAMTNVYKRFIMYLINGDRNVENPDCLGNVMVWVR